MKSKYETKLVPAGELPSSFRIATEYGALEGCSMRLGANTVLVILSGVSLSLTPEQRVAIVVERRHAARKEAA